MNNENLPTVAEIAKPIVDAVLAEHRALSAGPVAPPPAPPTPEQQLAAAQLREHVRDAALACGALPQATRHIVRDAEQVFELKDGQVVAKGNARDPLNPLADLTLVSWLAQLHEEESFLFEPLAR
jgi:hypothetical protein